VGNVIELIQKGIHSKNWNENRMAISLLSFQKYKKHELTIEFYKKNWKRLVEIANRAFKDPNVRTLALGIVHFTC